MLETTACPLFESHPQRKAGADAFSHEDWLGSNRYLTGTGAPGSRFNYAPGAGPDALPVRNGAPLRLRVERQLGYKHAKFITAIEFVDSFANIAGGKGGYWEDQGYHWWAGI